MLNFGPQKELPTVLLIDDDLISREVMATMLTMSGYSVHTAISGEAALDLLAAGECVPGVILIDAQMPGLSGIPLIEQLRARSKAIVYAISGSAAPQDVIAAADGFLLKPFSPDDLSRMLEERQAKAAPAAARKTAPAGLVVNPETLAQLREMMPEDAVRQIYAAIVADLGRRIAALEVAFAKNAAAEIRRIGHAIKGGCSMAGAMQAANIGAAFESAGNHLDNNSALLEDLRAAALNLKRMLEAEFPA
jgi:CheY-like chemotaxis protein/HPt (histidine-containing phosphotransfer) domain-containing protein